jgi:pimeloyl-ACP methyl ester carboxylesterase
MGMERHIGLGLSLALTVMISCPSSSLAQEQAQPQVDRTLIPYASTKDSVTLRDGRTIHLVCMGQGSPVVLLAAGGDGWSIAWNLVQPAVAKKTRVCAWDRAGLGLSSPSPKPQTVDNTTADLKAALDAGHIGGPYIMVGHSIGGFDALLFADHHPSDVRGIVLVDPSLHGDAT